jgi:hypothetical protein
LEFYRYCQINDSAKKAVIPMELWPHVKYLTRCFEDNQQVIVLKSKQIGVSYTLAFYALWKVLTQKAFNVLILSAGEKEASMLLDKCKFAYTHLPVELQKLNPYEKWTESEISFPKNGSKIVALPSTKTAGIGSTASLVIIDEWDFHPYPEHDFATAEPTASAGGQIIGVSTPNGDLPGSFFKTMFTQAENGENSFKPVFLGWFVRPDRNQNWFIQEQKSYVGREWQFKWNYPSTAQEALSPLLGRTFFNQNPNNGITLQQILESVKEPVTPDWKSLDMELMPYADCISIYAPWRPGTLYVAGSDVAEGRGGDFQATVLLGKQGGTSEVMAVIHSNRVQTDTYAWLIEKVCKLYKYPLLAVEKNSIGLACINKLQELNYPKLYYADDKQEVAGWYTVGKGANKRETVLVECAVAFASGELITHHKPMVLQMFNFQKTDKGRVEAVNDHDDLVMATSIAYQLAKKGYSPTHMKHRPLVVERSTAGVR